MKNNKQRFATFLVVLMVVVVALVGVGVYVYVAKNANPKPAPITKQDVNQQATIAQIKPQVVQNVVTNEVAKKETATAMPEEVTKNELQMELQKNIGGLSGSYKYQSIPSGDFVGTLNVLQTSDSDIIFSLFAGGPRDHVGIIYATKVKLNGNSAIYEKDFGVTGWDGKICKFEILFNENSAAIKEVAGGIAGDSPCDFGAGVMADFTYSKISNDVPELSKWSLLF
ncbi:MAG TPA: hypothetical protein PLA19_01980 [Candidatus Pacearchaeota archaeon]|nr:hypothetical protein [Candidatus Pacearchaeota archaeon]